MEFFFLEILQPKPNQPDMDYTVESLKKILNEPSEPRKAAESEKRKNLNESFKTASFDDLVSKAAAKVTSIKKSSI